METAIVYWGYVGIIPEIMEKKMETTIVYWDSRDVISLGSQAEAILGHGAQARGAGAEDARSEIWSSRNVNTCN